MHSIRKAFFFLKQHQRQSHTIGKQDEVKIHTEQTSTGIIDEQSIITTIMVVYCLFKVIMYKRLWKWAKLRITFKVQIFSLSINPLNYLKCSSQIPRAHSGVFKLLVLSTQAITQVQNQNIIHLPSQLTEESSKPLKCSLKNDWKY